MFLPALVLVSLVLPAPAPSAAAAYQLQVVAGPSVQGCVEAAALQSAVAAHLGYDPFQTGAKAQLLVKVGRDGAGLLYSSIDLVDAQGVARGHREVRPETARCGVLAGALALSISIAIDPERALEAPPEPASLPVAEPEPEPEPKAEVEPQTPSTPEPPPRKPEPVPRRAAVPRPSSAPAPWRAEGSLGAMTLLGIAPLPAFGASLDLQAGQGAWRLGSGVRLAGAPGGKVDGGARLSASLFAGELSACFQPAPWELCAVALVGDTAARASNVDHPRTAHSAFVAGGGRAGLAAPLSKSLALWLRVDALGVLWPIRPQVDGQTVWSAPLAAGSLGAGVRLRFL